MAVHGDGHGLSFALCAGSLTIRRYGHNLKFMRITFTTIVFRAAICLCAVVAATSVRPVEAAEEQKVLQAHRTKIPPVIDGRLDEPAWDEADRAVGFSNYDHPDSMAADQTVGRILFDDENLYIGIECLESRMDLLQTDLAAMGNVFDYKMAEVVEVFVDPSALGNPDYAQFMLGANGASAGSFYDAMQIGDMPYRTAVSMGRDRFFAEIAIPLSSLHLGPEATTTWGFNLNRARMVERETSHGPNDNRFSSWNNTGGAFNRPHRFGRLKIDLDTSRYWYEVRLLTGPVDSLNQTDVRIANRTGRSGPVKVTLSLDTPSGEKRMREQVVSLGKDAVKVVTFAGPLPPWAVGAAVSVTLADPVTDKTVYYGQTRSADATPGHEGPVPEYPQRATDHGYVLFAKDYNALVLRTYMPSLAEIDKPLELCASPGEYEPCVLGVRALRNLAAVKVDVIGDLVSDDGQAISGDNIDLRIVTETKYWTGKGKGQEFRRQPMLVEADLPKELDAGRTYAYWVTVKVPPSAVAGHYTGRLRFAVDGAPARHVPIHVTVWPFQLLTPPEMCWGYYYDVNRLPDNRRTLAYQKSIFRNLAEYGVNNVTIYGGISPDGALDACDRGYLPFAPTINDALAAGAMTPGIPVMTLGSAIMTNAVAAAATKHNWPPLLMYAYDEPDDEERIAVARKGLTQIKKDHPEVKTVTAISERGLEALGDLYDAWVIGAGSIGSPVVSKGRDQGKLIWMYDCGNRVCDLVFNRYFAGIFSWKTEVTGNWLWGLVDVQFEHRTKRPMAEVLQHDSEALWRMYHANPDDFNFTFNYIWPAAEGPVPSVGHIGRREGIDDYKYVYTLRKFIDKAADSDNATAQNAAREAEVFLDHIFAKVSIHPLDTEAHRRERKRLGGDIILGDWRPSIALALDDFNQFRNGIAEQIVILQRLIDN